MTRPDGLTVDPTYDAGGRLSTLAFSRGSLGMSYHPTTGLLTSLTAPDNVGLAYTYDGALLTSMTWSGPVSGSVSWTYDTDFRVQTQSVNGGNAVAMTYDADSLLTGVGGALALARDPQRGGLLTGTA